MQIKNPTKKQLNVFVAGLTLILLFFYRKLYKANYFNLSFLSLVLISVLLILYLIKKDFVIQFYRVWMRCVSFIGIALTGILMIFIFYLVFAPVGVFLRLFKKDILNLKMNRQLKTYWIDKPQKEFNKSSYEKQF